jgi:hypothetical protein
LGRNNKKVIIAALLVVVVLLVFILLLVQKATKKATIERKYSEYVTLEVVSTEINTTSESIENIIEEATNGGLTEETTGMLDYLQELESKKADGTYIQPEVETYDYSLPYELFPYHITLGLYKEDVVLDFFSSDKYFQYKDDMGELGIYALESLYNICKMYDYTQDDLKECVPTVFTDDASVVFNYNTPNGLLILVVDTINAQAYFAMESEPYGE